jgi:hypothetical protein
MSKVGFRVGSRAAKGDNMQVAYRRCAGPDIPKDSITATILVFPGKGERELQTNLCASLDSMDSTTMDSPTL